MERAGEGKEGDKDRRGQGNGKGEERRGRKGRGKGREGLHPHNMKIVLTPLHELVVGS